MRVVLDYGGVVVDHSDEREYAHLLGVDPNQDPYPGWLAYYLFRAGFLNSEAQYVELLSTVNYPALLVAFGDSWRTGLPDSTTRLADTSRVSTAVAVSTGVRKSRSDFRSPSESHGDSEDVSSE